MPRISDLLSFIEKCIGDGSNVVLFKVLDGDFYVGKKWGFADEVLITIHRDRVVVDIHNRFDEIITKEFGTINEAVEWILKKYPPSSYVYYYTKYRPPPRNYYPLKEVLGFVNDEVDSYSILIARAMDHLNGRRLLGFRLLSNTSKKCDECGVKKAEVQAVFYYHGARYGVYYCRECWRKTVDKIHDTLVKRAKIIKSSLELT